MDHLVATLKQEGLCKEVYYKEMYIPEETMKGSLRFLHLLLKLSLPLPF